VYHRTIDRAPILDMKKKASIVLVLLLAVSVSAAGKKNQPDLSSIETLYVGSMGRGEDAERLRLVLPAFLIEAGFQVAEEKSAADAALSGVLLIKETSTSLPDESGGVRSSPGTDVRVDLTLKSVGGQLLWDRQVTPHVKDGDPVQACAEAVVKQLSKALKRPKSRK
jgi:hypothetical protein